MPEEAAALRLEFASRMRETERQVARYQRDQAVEFAAHVRDDRVQHESLARQLSTMLESQAHMQPKLDALYRILVEGNGSPSIVARVTALETEHRVGSQHGARDLARYSLWISALSCGAAFMAIGVAVWLAFVKP